MKNKFLKSTLVLALGLSVLAPNVSKSYAADSNSELEESVKTSKEKYQETYAHAKEKFEELKEYKNDVRYINEKNQDSKRLFVSYLGTLESTLTQYNEEATKDYTSDQYDDAIIAIDNALAKAIEYKDNLNGKRVSNRELNELVDIDATFRSSDAFKNASADQQTKYKLAVDQAKDALRKFDEVPEVEYEKALKDLKAARESIQKTEEESKVKDELVKEIKAANEVEKDLYTEKSYLAFRKALLAAQTTANTSNSTAEQYQASLEALKAAKDSLVEVDSEEDKAFQELIADLKKSLEENKIKVRAVNFLFENTPKTVENVREKLEGLLKESEDLVKQTQEFLDEIEKVQG